jgi:peroxiredoxin
MKKLIIALFMLSSLSIMAQQREVANPKLEALQNEKDQAVLAQKIMALKDGTDDDLMVLVEYYTKDPAKKEAVIKTLQKKYPVSQNARMMRMMSFLNIEEIPKMEAHLQSMINANPNLNLDMEKSLLSSRYAEEPNSAKVLKYVNSMEDPAFKLRALTMAIELMAPIDKAKALELATAKFEEAKKLKGKTALVEPLMVDPKAAYDDFINIYSKLLFKAGKNEQAYKYTIEAYNNIKNRDGELTENYAYLSSLNGKYEEALPILAKVVKEGKLEARYIEQVRMGYAKLNPGKDVDAYIAELKKDFINKTKSYVEKLIVNETPPDFYIKDVNGKKVTLADFKGKTIILDFWATWCGPCVESFPAMQMAVDRYKDDPNVKFLFIHTAERVADPLTDAKNFLSKRGYRFDLYMDTKDPVLKAPPALAAFKITGIPMKYIIDGNGQIRFKVSGFKGKDEAVTEEVVQMVEMARKS